jgi:hypothetical protein
MSPRRQQRHYARLILPPLACLVLSAFVQHGCELLSSCGVPGLWLQVDALFLIFPLLYLRLAVSVPQVVFTGLALDAFWPGPYGTRLVIYCLVLICMLPLRARIRRENPSHVFWLSLLMNLLVFLGLWIVAAFSSAKAGGVPLLRILGDLAVSELVVGAAAFWWMELQRKAITVISDEDPANYTII